MEQEQDVARKELVERQLFADECKKKLRAMIPAPAPRVMVPIFWEVPQAEVKEYCPAECNVWKDNGRVQWWFHVHPFKRRKFEHLEADGGDENETTIAMLRRGWALANYRGGRDLDDCPLEGLFADGVPNIEDVVAAGVA